MKYEVYNYNAIHDGPGDPTSVWHEQISGVTKTNYPQDGATAGSYIVTITDSSHVSVIKYSLKTAGNVNIAIFNSKGLLIKTLANGTMSAGGYSVPFNSAQPVMVFSIAG